MLPRHSNELLKHLEDVVEYGCTTISKAKLIYWYGQQRLTVGIWRDIQSKWVEILESVPVQEDLGIPLFAGGGDPSQSTVTLVWGEGLTSDGKWLKPISELARS
ncbi:hypothetical protein [Tardiphaga sp. 839_C3_N1_4]|jgi:hypothetical protein|uniref:hypothetical protein n=1 Tax=Tardiphaga sp. 839_C3_N1_4 TaxID=3240761 RepID=UPI003F20C024